MCIGIGICSRGSTYFLTWEVEVCSHITPTLSSKLNNLGKLFSDDTFIYSRGIAGAAIALQVLYQALGACPVRRTDLASNQVTSEQ